MESKGLFTVLRLPNGWWAIGLPAAAGAGGEGWGRSPAEQPKVLQSLAAPTKGDAARAAEAKGWTRYRPRRGEK